MQTPVLLGWLFEWTKDVVTKRTARDSKKITLPMDHTTQNVKQSVEDVARMDTLLTLKEDIKNIEQNVQALANTLLTIQGDIKKIHQSVEVLEIQAY